MDKLPSGRTPKEAWIEVLDEKRFQFTDKRGMITHEIVALMCMWTEFEAYSSGRWLIRVKHDPRMRDKHYANRDAASRAALIESKCATSSIPARLAELAGIEKASVLFFAGSTGGLSGERARVLYEYFNSGPSAPLATANKQPLDAWKSLVEKYKVEFGLNGDRPEIPVNEFWALFMRYAKLDMFDQERNTYVVRIDSRARRWERGNERAAQVSRNGPALVRDVMNYRIRGTLERELSLAVGQPVSVEFVVEQTSERVQELAFA